MGGYTLTLFHVDIPFIFANLGIHSMMTFALQSRGLTSLLVCLLCYIFG